MIGQRTLGSTVCTAGVGLHSGESVQLTIRPAPPDAGIVFRRDDLRRRVAIRATAANVVDTRLATTLGAGEVRVATVEHLMAAFAGLGIDNARIDLNGPELPILDGSAAPFVALLEHAGIVEQSVPKRFLRMVREVVCTVGCSVARLAPCDGFRIEYTMCYDHPFFVGQRQYATLDFSASAFVRDVSRARTFGILTEIEDLKAMGLVRGGSLDNAVVVDDNGILNDDGLRYEDEFVKHKMLDAVGDLYLVGHPIIGAFSGYQSGHATNNALLRQLLADRDAYEWATFEKDASPIDLRLGRSVRKTAESGGGPEANGARIPR